MGEERGLNSSASKPRKMATPIKLGPDNKGYEQNSPIRLRRGACGIGMVELNPGYRQYARCVYKVAYPAWGHVMQPSRWAIEGVDLGVSSRTASKKNIY